MNMKHSWHSLLKWPELMMPKMSMPCKCLKLPMPKIYDMNAKHLWHSELLKWTSRKKSHHMRCCLWNLWCQLRYGGDNCVAVVSIVLPWCPAPVYWRLWWKTENILTKNQHEKKTYLSIWFLHIFIIYCLCPIYNDLF